MFRCLFHPPQQRRRISSKEPHQPFHSSWISGSGATSKLQPYCSETLSRWEAKQLDSFVALRHTKDERKKRKSFRFVSCWAAHHLQTKIELDDLFSAAAWQISNTLILCVSSLVWTSATSISSASHHHYPLAEHPAAQKLITQPHTSSIIHFFIDGYFIDWALVSDDDETRDTKKKKITLTVPQPSHKEEKSVKHKNAIVIIHLFDWRVLHWLSSRIRRRRDTRHEKSPSPSHNQATRKKRSKNAKKKKKRRGRRGGRSQV